MEINQSTVSHSIEKLRGILGDGLFVQAGRGITPSAHAEMVAPKVGRLLADMEALADLGDYDPHEDKEPYYISSIDNALDFAGIKIRDAIWRHVPDKTVIFYELLASSNPEAFLNSGRSNIAVAPRPLNYSTTLKHQPLFSDQFVVFYDASVHYPVRTLSKFCNARHAKLDLGGNAQSELDEVLGKHGRTRRIACMAPNAWMLAEMVRGTNMVTTLPSKLADTVFSGPVSYTHLRPTRPY